MDEMGRSKFSFSFHQIKSKAKCLLPELVLWHISTWKKQPAQFLTRDKKYPTSFKISALTHYHRTKTCFFMQGKVKRWQTTTLRGAWLGQGFTIPRSLFIDFPTQVRHINMGLTPTTSRYIMSCTGCQIIKDGIIWLITSITCETHP